MAAARPPEARTVQDYIDEVPAWRDGTPVAMVPITAMQWRIWWLATAGKFFEGFVVFMTGVALPLIGKDFGLGAAVTWLFRIETSGVNLERLGNPES